MRVITGSARGRKLVTPAGEAVRPTSDMAKEAIFSILQNEIAGSAVLDLFAGSGQLGIEALSRGASNATFIDNNKESIACIKENLKNTGLFEKSSVAMMDSLAFLKGNRTHFDVVLMDPPYNKQLIDEALPLVEASLSEQGVIVCETERKEQLPPAYGTFTRRKEYLYGKVKVTVYRRAEEMEDTE